jgi:hypothetical protein
MASETRKCGNCQREKPLTAYYKIDKPGWRVTFCAACARWHMRVWEFGLPDDGAAIMDAGR